MARIVLNTFGSLGDLHPYLALALGLQKRGHAAVIATSAVYRKKVEAVGLEFASVRPDAGELTDRPEFVKKLWDARKGSEYLLRDYLIPAVEQGFEDLVEVCRGADLLLTHAAAYAGPIVGELLRMPWISVALQPAVFFSAQDPSVLAPAPWLRHLFWLGPQFYRALLGIAEREINGWTDPIVSLRKKLGLPAPRANPVMWGQFSPLGTLALFSDQLAKPQQDWPPNTKRTGFLFYDQLGEGLPGYPGIQNELPSGLSQFLEKKKAPVLFTLGSSAVMQAGSFYSESVRAIEKLGQTAILLVGHQQMEALSGKLPEFVFAADYIPYSEVMPKVSAIVHQGGIGTTAQGLRAGKPVLVVPWAHDQPDNAERLRRLGVGRWIARDRYRALLVARQLRLLLQDERYARRAEAAALQVNAEDGEKQACDAVEDFLRASTWS